MKVLVTVAEVAVVDDEFELDGLAVDERYLTHELNEWDEYAVEEAVQVSEEHDDVEVVTATIGPEQSEERIRKALAKGADRAIRVWDDDLADRDVLDPVTKAEVLAGVVESEAPDLVLSGVQKGDDAYGATGVALAETVGYEWAAVVNDLDLDRDRAVASVRRELEGGVEEVTEVDVPAVLSIQTGINEPRYASLRGIRQAQSKPLDVHSPSDLGVDLAGAGDRLALTALYEPESESDATVFEGEPEETAAELGDVLREEGVVDG